MPPKQKSKAISKPKPATPVTALKHKDKRVNIPTEELRDFIAEEEKKPKTILYPRDPSLVSSTKTGPQVLADFVHELVVEAQAHLEAAKQQFEDASTEVAAEMLEQATVDLAAAQSIKELADRNQLTDKRLQTKLKELRG